MPVVDKFYVPKDATIECLKKNNFTREHIWKVVKQFRVSFRGKEYKDIEQKFKDVMSKEFATDAPAKPDNSKEIISTRNTDLENKSKDGADRAQEAKGQEGILTKEQAIFEYDSRR